MHKLNLAVLFGGRSTEHEVSIITAIQVLNALDDSKYRVTPIYISKAGTWHLGDKSFFDTDTFKDLNQPTTFPQVSCHPNGFLATTSFLKTTPLKIDLVLPILHGTFGEDGCVQGTLETLNIPYAGCGVLASSLGMDKLAQKTILTSANIPQVKYLGLFRSDWQNNPQKVLNSIKSLKLPLFVKPANGGSSIGITKVKTLSKLANAINVACIYDTRVVIEESVENAKEINISVLGNSGSKLRTSVCEQPLSSSELLSYEDKYLTKSSGKGMASTKRLLPAPIHPSTAQKITNLAKLAFTAINASGIARIDFLVSRNEKQIFLNEINTLPGSLSFYLWEKSDLSFSHLLDEFINLGLNRSTERNQNLYTFNSNLLAGINLNGTKTKS